MQELLTAIYTRFSSTPYSSFYNDISGRLFLEEVEQNVEYPYAVLRLLNNSHDWTFDSEMEETAFEFVLVSDSTAGATEITDMYKHCSNLFDHCDLTVTNYNHIYMHREQNNLQKIPGEIADKSIWQMNIQYRTLIHKKST